MLPPANRLRKEKEIKRVLASKKSYKDGLLICKTAPNGFNTARFCFVVSKRISNKAVVRNKLKRRLRHAVIGLLPRVKQNVDCVLISCPGLQLKTFGELRCIIEKVLLFSGVVR
jgi:ribonuclease P protein component